MKKILSITFIIALSATMFVSCSKEKTLKKRIVGTWNMDKLEGTITPSGGGAAIPLVFTNAGTMTFKDDGNGSYQTVILGSTTNGTITWTNTATTVTVNQSGEPTKIYTVSTNEKTKQVWTTTYTDNGDQVVETLTMSKK